MVKPVPAQFNLQTARGRRVCRVFKCLVGSPRSHLPFRLLTDPVGELHHLRVDAGAVQPGAALTPAHDPGQEPPPASLQTHQRAPGVPLDYASKQKTFIVVRKRPASWLLATPGGSSVWTHTDLAGVHSALQVSSTKHPGSDGIVVQLVARVPADDLHRGLL